MLQRIRLNLEAVEAMLYYWQAASEKDNIPESFFYDVSEIERLEEEARERFYQEDWSVASEADRIGYRFKGGTPLRFIEREPPFGAGDDPSNIVDACYPIGSIQVPAGSEPIILHRDAVSGGGYAMVGTVISADMDLVGQIQPHQKVRFVGVSLEQALDARKAYAERLEALRQALGPAQGQAPG